MKKENKILFFPYNNPIATQKLHVLFSHIFYYQENVKGSNPFYYGH